MINIKDRYNRTNILIERDEVEANYVQVNQFENDVESINKRIAELSKKIDDTPHFPTVILQDLKTVDMTELTELVTADEEYDGMKSVEINAFQVYDRGVNDGIEQGYNNAKSELTDIVITENGEYTTEQGFNRVTVDVSSSGGGIDYDAYSYSKKTVDEDSFKQIGWSDDDINYFKVNVTPDAYNVEYKVSDENVALCNDIEDVFWESTEINDSIKKNPEFQYIKPITLQNSFAYGTFSDCHYLKALCEIKGEPREELGEFFKNCYNLEFIPQIQFKSGALIYLNDTFKNCHKLTIIPDIFNDCIIFMPSNAFDGCHSLRQLPWLNFSKEETTFSFMFKDCRSITTIPEYDFSSATQVDQMLKNCVNLKSLPLLDFSKVKNINSFFGENELTYLTDLGGFKGLKIDWNDGYGLNKCPNLTKESVLNVINHLYDFRANGDSTTTKTIKFNSKSLSLLSDEEKQIATNKGWVISMTE